MIMKKLIESQPEEKGQRMSIRYVYVYIHKMKYLIYINIYIISDMYG